MAQPAAYGCLTWWRVKAAPAEPEPRRAYYGKGRNDSADQLSVQLVRTIVSVAMAKISRQRNDTRNACKVSSRGFHPGFILYVYAVLQSVQRQAYAARQLATHGMCPRLEGCMSFPSRRSKRRYARVILLTSCLGIISVVY